MLICGACGPMRACDSSLELSRPPYEQDINKKRFARAARPQSAKMSFAHYISPHKTTVLRLAPL